MPRPASPRPPPARGAAVRAVAFIVLVVPLVVSGPAGAACPATRVALDAGHTPGKPGAISAGGVPEYTFNRALATAVAAALARRGITSVRLNAGEREVTLRARTREAEVLGATLFLSLHHDSVQPQYLQTVRVAGSERRMTDRFRGYSLFISGRHREPRVSRRLADAVGAALRQAGFSPSLHHAEPIAGENRPLLDASLGLYRFDDLVVLRSAPMPALLIEAGIIVNPVEEAWLRSAEGRARLAAAIAGGVAAFCISELPTRQ